MKSAHLTLVTAMTTSCACGDGSGTDPDAGSRRVGAGSGRDGQPPWRDSRTLGTATRAAVVAAILPTFRRTWAAKWSTVAVSLDEAGAGLTTFTVFPPTQ